MRTREAGFQDRWRGPLLRFAVCAAMPDDPCVEILHLPQPGVTKPHPDRAASATWLASVYDSTRVAGGMVTTSVEEPSVGRNHYRVGMRFGDGKPLSILFNAAALL